MVTMAWSRTLQRRAFALLCAILFSLLVVEPATAKNSSQEWLPKELLALEQELDALRASALALAPLLDLQLLTGWMTAEQAEAVLLRAQNTVTDPYAKGLASYLLLRFYIESGAVQKAKEQQNMLGFVEPWRLVGPFRNDSMEGYDAVYPPELEGYQDPQQSFVGKFNDLRWLTLKQASEAGYIAADETIADASTAVLYATTECYFDASVHAAHMAVDGAYKLWIDERPIASKDHHLGGFALRDTAPVSLRRGWHRIFLKVATDRVAPGWHMRFVDKQGRSAVRECRPSEQAASPVEQPEVFPEAQSLRGVFESKDPAAWSDQQRIQAAYILRWLQPDDPQEPWVNFLNASDRDGLRPTARVRAARAEHIGWKKQRDVRDLDLQALSIQDALYVLALRSRDRALQAQGIRVRDLRALLERDADDPRLQLEWLETLADHANRASTATRALALVEKYGPRPELCKGVFHMAEQRDDHAETLYHACAARGLNSIEAIDAFLARKITRGDTQEALQAMAALEPLWEGRIDWLSVQENIARSQGDDVGALHAIDQRISRRPHDANAHQRRANILLRLGRDAEAAAALRTAIDLQPQKRDAQDLLALIETQGEKFYEKWRVDDQTLRQLAQELKADDHHLGVLVNQEVVYIYREGLSTTYVQDAFVVKSREGAEHSSAYGIRFVPGQHDLRILSAQVLRSDGTRRDSFQTKDILPYTGPSDIYDYDHERRLFLADVQIGDIVNIEYVKTDISQKNIFDDYFGRIKMVDSGYPTALWRLVLYHDQERELFAERSGERIDLPATITDGVAERIYEERNLPAVVRENYTPGVTEYLRYLHISTYNDVDKLANWYWNLIKDQLVTSPEMIETVHRLIDGISDPREKLIRIYNYVVQNTRYVSLGFGIGGFRPHRATSCFNQRYGDCKDTAALLKTMLGVADINSHIVLIRTSDIGRLKNHLPSLEIFNHAIIYVPAFDLYLDGTASYNGIDELYATDQGASSITVLDGQGGRAVETPHQPAHKNYERITFHVDARAPEIRGNFALEVGGTMGGDVRRFLAGNDQRDDAIKRWVTNLVPDVRDEGVTYQGLETLNTPVVVKASFVDGRWWTVRGDEIVIQPFAHEAFDKTDLVGLSDRKFALFAGAPSTEEISVELQLPATMYPVQLPQEKQVAAHPTFGKFEMRVQWDASNHVLRVHGIRVRDVAVIETSDYKAFRAWVREIYRIANQAILFKQHDAAE